MLWARLSVFAGDFSLDAAQQVCAHSPLGETEIADLLAGLVTKSLLVRDKWPDGERCRQLDTVRAYGGEWLRRLGEEQSQQSRHLAWCQAFAEQGERDWFGPGQAAVFHSARREHTHLFSALDSALSTPGQEEAGLRLAGTLWFYWVGCGLLGDGRYWLDRALAAASRLTPDRLKALWGTGYVAILQGDSAVAVSMLEDCRAQALRIDDDAAYAYATHRLGCTALIRDEHDVAQKYFETALARYAALGELNSNVLMARIELAMAFAFQGDLERAVEVCQQARHICDVHGERWGKAYVLYVLSFAPWSCPSNSSPCSMRSAAAAATPPCFKGRPTASGGGSVFPSSALHTSTLRTMPPAPSVARSWDRRTSTWPSRAAPSSASTKPSPWHWTQRRSRAEPCQAPRRGHVPSGAASSRTNWKDRTRSARL
ncbi:hypothetical protein AB0O76_29255 [Streptomyces sp. NPDC086554]|uniref:ATP-binding protein n=1 Tax=Streptomyces sp. NPDC086554 TaxID=3154864 RepID=UPI0034379735